MDVLEVYPFVKDRFSFIQTEGNGQYVVCDCNLKNHDNSRLRFWLGRDNRLMFGCYACGDTAKLEILRAAGLTWTDCFPEGTKIERRHQEVVARYPYRDEKGKLLYETIRLEPGYGGRDKDFRQRRLLPGGGWEWKLGDVRRVLYRLPELLAADPAAPVLVVAGEKDSDTLRDVGVLATTNVCGERSEWLDEYSAALAGRHVVVIQDDDATGKRHAAEVCGSLMGHAASVRRVLLPAKDATALVSALHRQGVTEPAEVRRFLWDCVKRAPRWEPAPARAI
jgi:5S rRNA maturation endonuclease (ribonuclease M5)